MKISYTKEELEYLIPDYITDNISEYDREQVEHGLKLYPDLMNLYIDMKSGLDLAGRIKFSEPGDDYWQGMISSIYKRLNIGNNRSDKKLQWKYMLPAAAAILLIIFYFMLRPEKIQITENNDLNIMTNDTISENKDNKQNELAEKQGELNKNYASDILNSEQTIIEYEYYKSFLSDNSYDSSFISDAGYIEQQEMIDEIEEEYGESILEGSEIEYDEISIEEENEILYKINNINL